MCPVSTPEESFETAVDESSDREAREAAIEALEAANECDMLAEVVTRTDLADDLRRRALDALATPQCEATMQDLAADDGFDLSDEAGRLLEDVDDIKPP